MEPALPGRARAAPKNSSKVSAYSTPEPHPYRGIIDDVLRNSRDLFLEEGIDESFISQLQYLWEARLATVLNPEAAAADPLHQALTATEDGALMAQQRAAAPKGEGEPPSKRQGIASKEGDTKPEKLPATEGAENEEEELGSDLDESEEQAPETDNLVLCQYEKVTRHKTKTGNRFKCVLKDGIMSLGGREILFHKGTGDAED